MSVMVSPPTVADQYDAFARQVVAHREHGLKQQRRPGRLGKHFPVQLKAHLPRTGDHVDSMEGVTRMGHVGLILFEPRVEGLEIEHNIPGQVGVSEAEPGTRAVVPVGAHVDGFPVGCVDGEREGRVQQGPFGQVAYLAPGLGAARRDWASRH